MEKTIQRDLFQSLQQHLKSKEISLIVGPRQAGKTTLMRALEQELVQNGAPTLFFNLDIEHDRQFFTNQDQLVRKLQLEIGANKKGFVFIDEIQRKTDAGLFLKGIYDMELPYKLIVSGSGSIELKEHIHESLAGRKRLFELSTLSWEEFVNFKTAYRYSGRLQELLGIDYTRGENLLNEYLNFGGYPRVVLADTIDEKQKRIEEIYRSYLERDIAYLLGVKKEENFTQLVRILASQIGNLVIRSELSSTLGLSTKTMAQYLWYLEKTYILDKVSPYFRNVRKEITKTPVYYFTDLGLRNWSAREFGRISDDPQTGFVFENFVYLTLARRAREKNMNIHFWRTKDGAEIDFIVEIGKEVVPVEVKYKRLATPEINRSFRSFLERYSPKRAYVVNRTLRAETKIASKNGTTRVFFIPYYDLTEKGVFS